MHVLWASAIQLYIKKHSLWLDIKEKGGEKEKRFCFLKKGCSDLACSGLTFDAPPLRLAFCFSFALVTLDTKAILSALERAIYCYAGHVLTVKEVELFFVPLRFTRRPPLVPLWPCSRGARWSSAEYVTNQRASGIVGIHGNRRGDGGFRGTTSCLSESGTRRGARASLHAISD